jgi:hypothetical protein
VFGIYKKYRALQRENAELRYNNEILTWKLLQIEERNDLSSEAGFALDVLEGNRSHLVYDLISETMDFKREEEIKKETDTWMRKEMDKITSNEKAEEKKG